MSGTNLPTNNSNPSHSFNINEINEEIRVKFEKLAYKIEHQLFLDVYLNHRQCMFLLYRSAAIKNEFLRYLHHCTYGLDVSQNGRADSVDNLNDSSTGLVPMAICSNINQYNKDDDSDEEETYAECLSDIDFDEDDTCDDIENILLDQLEFEHDIAVFNSTASKKAEHLINNTDNKFTSN